SSVGHVPCRARCVDDEPGRARRLRDRDGIGPLDGRRVAAETEESEESWERSATHVLSSYQVSLMSRAQRRQAARAALAAAPRGCFFSGVTSRAPRTVGVA